MRVGSVSCAMYRSQVKVNKLKNSPTEQTVEENLSPNFKANFGKIIGGTAGLASVVAASFAFPPLICLAGAGLAAGVVGGDVIEDKVNGEGEDKDKDKDKGKQ